METMIYTDVETGVMDWCTTPVHVAMNPGQERTFLETGTGIKDAVPPV